VVALSLVETVGGALTNGAVVVVVVVMLVSAIAPPVIKPSAAAPASNNLIMRTAFQKPGCEGITSTRSPTIGTGCRSGAGSDSTYAGALWHLVFISRVVWAPWITEAEH
jgi:hypothetical protein